MSTHENPDRQTSVKPVLFTDLDGTLLDRDHYTYEPAIDAIHYLKKYQIPIVFCSAKTRREQEYYRQEMGISDPFIVENGGAIYIPKDYFQFKYNYNLNRVNYHVIELGISHMRIRQIIEKIRMENSIDIKGFEDITIEQISAVTGLGLDMAARARDREYDEVILPLADNDENKRMLDTIIEAKLNYTSGGRLYEVMGNNDKGKAIQILGNLFRKRFGQIITIGIGDNLNDLPMLQQVDMPFLVQKPDGQWEKADIKCKKTIKVDGIGPHGWAKVFTEYVSNRLAFNTPDIASTDNP